MSGLKEKNMSLKNKSEKGFTIVFLAFLVSFIGSYPQFQLSPLSYLIIPNLGLTPTQFSSVFSASMIPGVLLGLISGLLCDKFGVKKCVNFAGIVASIGIVFRIWSFNYLSLLICMILSGVGATFISSNISKLLSKWFPPEKLGSMIGLVFAGTTASQVIGMSTTAYFPTIKSAFIVAGILSIVIAILWIIFAKESPSNNNTTEKMQNHSGNQSTVYNMKIVLFNKYIWFIGLGLLFVMASILTISPFLPLALQSDKGLTAQAAGLVSSVVLFGSLIGTVAGPMICEKLGNTKLFLFACGIISGLGIALVWTLPAGSAMMVVMFIIGFTSNSIIPIMVSLPIRLDGINFECAGTAGGVVATIQLLGAVIVPTYIIVPIASTNYSLLFILAGICLVMSGIVSLTLPNFEKK